MDGLPAIVVQDLDIDLRVRELTMDRDVGLPLRYVPLARSGVVELDGRAVVVSAGVDLVLRRWDLASRTPLGEPVPIPEFSTATDLYTVQVDGRPAVLSHVGGVGLLVRDFATGAQIAMSEVLRGTVTELDGVAVVVGIPFEGISVTDMRTGTVVRELATGRASVLATAVAGDRPVAITDGEQNTILVHDLHTGERLGAPLTGHEAPVTALGVADLRGRPVLVSAARDNAIRVWDLAVRVPPVERRLWNPLWRSTSFRWSGSFSG